MRKRNLILLIVLVLVIPVLLSGCFLWPKKAVLEFGINPNKVPLSTTITLTYTLRELNGVGVSLNYMKYEIFNQWNQIIGGWEQEGAEFKFQNWFGSSYIPGNGELSYSNPSGNVLSPQRHVFTCGGTDDNGNTVRVSAEILYGL